jgi:hypothetical protein
MWRQGDLGSRPTPGKVNARPDLENKLKAK